MTTKPPVFNLLAKSPAACLTEHMSKANMAVEALPPFFDAVFVKDWVRARQLYILICNLEHEADALKKDLRLNLPKSPFSLIPREEVLLLVNLQDAVANRAKNIAKIILERKMQLPDSLAPQFKALVQRSVEVSYQAMLVMAELDNLIGSDFQLAQVKLVESMITELDRLEQQTDEMQGKLRAMLFELESLLSPIDVIFLYKIIEAIGDLADRAQHVGERLQMLLVR